MDGDDYEGDLDDVDAVKRWLKSRREASKLTQEELAVFMGATGRVVLNAEKEGDPKAGLPRGYPFFRMLQRLGVVVPDAPVPAGPTLHDRLQRLEDEVRETQDLIGRGFAALGVPLQLLAPQQPDGDAQAASKEP